MKFNYQARIKTGEVQSGVIEASSRETALDLLQKSQLFVTALEEAGSQHFYAKKIKLFDRVSAKELVAFSRQLALMFKAKIPLSQSLRTLAEQTKNRSFKEKILMISDEIEAGAPFSQALSRFPKLFSSFFVNMVKSGEASGTLTESLNYLADHLEREYHLFSKLKGALVYPALILVVSVGVLLMMMFFVIPNLAKVLTETGQELPVATRIVIALSNFLRHSGWILFTLIAIAVFFVSRWFGTTDGRKFKDRLVLRIPLVKIFLKMIFVSRFAENLSTLISGGLPITQSLEITGDVVGNSLYKERIEKIKEEVKEGRKVSGILAEYPEEFPALLTQMVIIGEKTGTLDQSLMNVVDFYRKEVDLSMESLLSLLEPIMIIFLGLTVAGLMGSVLLPLYKMTSI